MSRSLKGSLLSLEEYYRSNPHTSPSWAAGSKPFKPLVVQEKKAKKKGPKKVSKSEFERLQLDEWLRPAMEQLASCPARKTKIRIDVDRSKVESAKEVKEISVQVDEKLAKESRNASNNKPIPQPATHPEPTQPPREPEKKQTSSTQRKESLKARLKKNPLLRFMSLVCS